MDKGAEMNKVLSERVKILEKEGRELGLDFYPIIYEVVPQETMLEIMSYGLPTRARHWSYGQSYEYQKMQGEMGFSKVYEVILNNDPSYAFLLDTNSDVINTLVIAHVLGHSHFFKNNYLFKQTDNKMVYHAAERAQRIEGYIERFGIDAVERTMDIGFALDRHIDWHKGVHRKLYEKESKFYKDREVDEFSDLLDEKGFSKVEVKPENKFPPAPEFDILWFLINYSKSLEPWQVDVLDIIRKESYYFYPQYLTKTMNEGLACVTGDSLVFTEQGILPMEDLVKGDAKFVNDNETNRLILARSAMGEKRCIKITTKRGYEICGADNHKILSNGEWVELQDLSLGDRADLAVGAQIWSEEYREIIYNKKRREKTIADVAALAGVSSGTICRRLRGKNVLNSDHIDSFIKIYKEEKADPDFRSNLGNMGEFSIPKIVDEKLGRFLGLLVGDGHISRANRSFGLTSGDKVQAEEFRDLAKSLFGVKTKIKKDEGRYRANCYSEGVSNFLENYIGCTTGVSARRKNVPKSIMESPKSVMSAFISGLFDADGCAHKGGITFVSSSKSMVKNLQIILTNYNIISSRNLRKDETYALTIGGISAKRFYDQIGFGLTRKQEVLKTYIFDRKWFCKENSFDSISKIEELKEVVYDISVEKTHRYSSNGFINHNSLTHAELMFSTDCINHSEHLNFCKVHEKVVQPGGNKLNINPYFLGFSIFGDIIKRWDAKKEAGESEIGGWEKVFQVVQDEDDISFIRNYLTKELAEELKLFTYVGMKMASGDEAIHIVGTELDIIKESLVKDLYHYRAPLICITSIEDGVLQLQHKSGDIGTLDYKHLEATLEYIYEAWGAPVNIETVDSRGNPTHFTYDELGFGG